VGEYYSDDLDATFVVARATNGGLTLRIPRRAPQALVFEGDDRFRAGGTRLRFVRDGAAPAATMVVEVARMGAINFTRRREP
jgi:hypothetical protein